MKSQQPTLNRQVRVKAPVPGPPRSSAETGWYKPLAFFRLFRIKQKTLCLASWGQWAKIARPNPFLYEATKLCSKDEP